MGNLLAQDLPDNYLEIIFDYTADGRNLTLKPHRALSSVSIKPYRG